MSTQGSAPAYQFLSQPPPQKKRPAPNQPLPSPPQGQAPLTTHDNVRPRLTPVQPPLRRRSNTTSAISAWAAAVQPGSPSPCSPPARCTPTHRRPSITRGRRSSITSRRVPSASFLSLTPSSAQTHSINLTPGGRSIKTPSTAEGFDFLICAGYSAAFVRIPVPPTPVTPAIPSSNNADFKDIPIPPIPSSPAKSQAKSKGMRLRSLSFFKRGRSKSVTGATCGTGSTPLLSPAKTAKKASGATQSQRAASIAAKKRKKYPKLPAPLPLTLAQEAEIAQLLDGGSTRVNVQRVMRDKAVARGAHVRKDGTIEGVAMAAKDEYGVWWEDVEEREEFAHLLDGADEDASPGAQWVEFTSPTKVADPRRESPSSSGTTPSSADSELDPQYRVLPAPEGSVDDLALFGFASTDSVTPSDHGRSVLALPARPRRIATHLRRPALLHDAFVALPSSPKSPRSPKLPKQAKGRGRRRPAPLALAPPSPARKRAVNGQDARRIFLEDVFEPMPPVPATAPLPVVRAQQADAAKAAKVVSHKPSVWKLLRRVKA